MHTRILIAGLDPAREPDHRAPLQGLCELLTDLHPQLELSVVHGGRSNEYAALDVPPEASEITHAIRTSELILWRPALDLPENVGAAFDLARIALAAHHSRAQVIAYLVDWQPPRTRRGRLHARTLLRGVQGVLAPAQWAHAELECPVTQVPDPSFMLRPVTEHELRARLASLELQGDGRDLLGVDLRPFELAPRSEENRLLTERFPGLVAQTLDEITTRTDAGLVLLENSHDESLLALHAALRERLKKPVKSAHVSDPAMYKGIATRLRCLLTDRPAPAILAASVGRPVVGLGARGRLDATLALLGPPHDGFDPELFARGGLVSQLGELLQTAIRLGRAPGERIEEIKAEAREAYRALPHADRPTAGDQGGA